MTAASELNSAAVVEVERHAGKAVAVNAEALNKRNNALKQEERCSSHDDTGFEFGSMTATATDAVPTEEVEEVKRTSGSKAAFNLFAASTQATGLPASSFSRAFPTAFARFSSTRAARVSFIKLRIQQNPVLLRHSVPERFSRASCAA
jgi:hypothetical protein